MRTGGAAQIGFLLLAGLGFSRSAQAALLDATASAACGVETNDVACTGGGNSLIYPLTVGTGTNRALAVFVAFSCNSQDHSNITSVTYNGVALAKATGHKDTNAETIIDIWALPAGTQPASGTHNVVVTFPSGSCGSGNYSVHSGAVSAYRVDQTTTFRSSALNDPGLVQGTAATLSLASSAASDLVASFVCTGSSVVSTPQSLKFLNNVSGSDACDSSAGAVASGGTTNLSWTVVSDWWDTAGVSFKDDGGSQVGSSISLLQHAYNQSTANSNQLSVTVAATGSNNLLVVATTNSNSLNVLGVSDGTNAFTYAGNSRGTATSSGNTSEIWYLRKSTSGKTTITITWNGAADVYYKEGWVWEVNGFKRVALDSANHVNDGVQSGGTATGPAITTTSTQGFIAAVDTTDGAVYANPIPGNEFVSGGDIDDDDDAACSLLSTSAGTHQPAWTDDGATYAASIAAFRETPAHRARSH